MKSFAAINGSATEEGSNLQLLNAIVNAFGKTYQFDVFNELRNLPLFTPDRLKKEIPNSVQRLKTSISEADAVIISTPEYLHNIPAVLKNALEWMTESGELAEKPVLPITFTPHEPRGEHAMKSLIQSLKASKAKVVAELPLYQNQLRNETGEIVLDEEHRFLLREAISLL